jgi:hypothetical protein
VVAFIVFSERAAISVQHVANAIRWRRVHQITIAMTDAVHRYSRHHVELFRVLVMSVAVQALAGEGDDTLMVGLYLWLYAGWVIALAGFLDLAAAAGWGALGMGTVAVPLAVQWLRRRR